MRNNCVLKVLCYISLLVILSLFVITCLETKTKEKNPAIEKISDMVSTSEIEKSVSDLIDFKTRWTYEKQIQVADYLHQRFKEFIPLTHFHEFEFWGETWKNVVATIPGTDHPEKVVIISAHLDSKSEKRLIFAPGADDNASGCAAILELVRILSMYTFENSIRFIIFSGEEYGWKGSAAYVKSMSGGTEKILGVINMDMIAYGKDNEDIDLVTRPEYSFLVDYISNLANLYGINTKKVVDKHCY